MKSKDYLLYPAELSFKIGGEIKSFPDKKKVKEFITTQPVLQEMLKDRPALRRRRRKEKEDSS